MDASQMVLTVIVAVITLVAAIVDVRTMKIPNVFTVSILAAGIVFHLVAGFLSGGFAEAGRSLLFTSLAGFAAGFAILFVLFAISGGGGGDVKLMAALGAWLGPWLITIVFLLSSAIVLVYSVFVLLMLVAKVGFRRTKQKYGEKEGETMYRRVARRIMPYSVSAAIATWIVLAYPYLKQYLIQPTG